MATCPTLFDVIYTGSCRCVEAALSRKDVNVLDFNDKGQTVIHIASQDKKVSFDVFKLVINKRREAINIKDHSAGNTPLHCACLANDLEKVRHLVKNGAQLEARNTIEETPLLVACKQQASEIVTYLLEKGANRDAEDNEQRTVATISHFSNNASLKIAIKTEKIRTNSILTRKLSDDFKKLKKENDEPRSQKQEMETKYLEASQKNATLVNLLENIMTEIKTKYSDQASLQNETRTNQLTNLKKELETKCLEISLQNATWTNKVDNLMKDIENNCLDALIEIKSINPNKKIKTHAPSLASYSVTSASPAVPCHEPACSSLATPAATASALPHHVNSHRAEAERRAANDGLRPISVQGDGACMFRAVCISDSGTDSGHLKIRTDTVNYMSSHESYFKSFLLNEADPDERLSFSSYLLKISQPHQQAGEFALNAIANVLGKQINVYYADCLPRQYSPEGHVSVVAPGAPGECVNILYIGSASCNSGHYEALIHQSRFKLNPPPLQG